MRAVSPLLLLVVIACNQPPEGGMVEIDPITPVTTDDLVATLSEDAVDPNGKDVTYSYAWSVDGSAADDVSGDTVPAAQTRKGQEWSVVVTPSDGKKVGPTFTASTTINNSPPVVSSVAISPGDVPVGDTLEVSFDGTDADDDIVETTISWTVDGTEVGTGTTLSTSGLSKGDQISVTVQPNDGEVDGVPVSAGPVSILNTAPTAPVAAITPAEPRVTTPLVCSLDTASTDVDGDALTYTAAWTVDGVAFSGTTQTSTHDGDTVPTTELAADQVWRCTLTAFDGEAQTPSAESDPVTVTQLDGVHYAAGYYWVIAEYNAPAEDHAAVCATKGLDATATQVSLTWDAALLDELSSEFGFTSAGVAGCCAEAMWCWDGADAPTDAVDGECETHNFGTQYWNYGAYTSNPASRPVFTCVEPTEEG